MNQPYKNCRWCKGLGVPECRVRRRRGWGSDGPRGPCTFCPVERDKDDRERWARAKERYEQTGEYRDPDFQQPMVYYDLESGRSYSLGDAVENASDIVM